MAEIKTPHGRIHYEIHGKGPHLVMIRGLGTFTDHWSGWDKTLAEYFTVITLDNRGLGKTSAPMKPWISVKTLAHDVKTIMRHERVENAHILGNSFGGMIAAEFAIQYPELTKSLILVASSIGRSGHLRLSPEAAHLILTAPFRKEYLYEKLADLLTAPKTSRDIKSKLAEEWKEIDSRRGQPKSTVLGQLIAALRFRDWEKLQSIKCPTLIVSGAQDRFVPKGNSLFLHDKIPQSQLREIQDAGHEPHIDQPEIVTNTLREFISGHS
jgi:pimeloyl-ACP methyl ester carboxylesterase